MEVSSNYTSYAAKMRGLVTSGVNLEADARFIDMLVQPQARLLDIGCGIGTAVNALRHRNHQAYGIDPSQPVLDVATDLFNPSWYHQLDAKEVSRQTLTELGLPVNYEGLLMAGNVPAFLTASELHTVFMTAAELLVPAGYLVTGTSTESRGGPKDQDRASRESGLTLYQRFSNWHLRPFQGDPWCVSVYLAPGTPAAHDGPDGIFVLPA